MKGHDIFNLPESYSQEDRIQIHQQFLEDFIKRADGLSGMVLIGIRETGSTTSIELTSGAKMLDLLRCAASITEAVMKSAGDSGLGDAGQAKMLSLITDMLLALAGDDRDDVEELWNSWDKGDKH